MKPIVVALLIVISCISAEAQQLAVLHYNGGGDWYSNPTSVPNLVNFCNQNLQTNLEPKVVTVKPETNDLFEYPFIHATGHGNILFNEQELENIRNYLLAGGFLHIDDNYGMAKFAKREIEKLFPNKDLVPIGIDHPIFKSPYTFNRGLPKIHEHEGKAPEAFGIFDNGRLILLLTVECDLGDGWEDAEVHNDPNEIRQKALEFGANIINYVFSF